MPIYEYQCDLCSEKFEVRCSFFEAMNSATCPLCKSNKTRRCWSVPSVIRRSCSSNDPSSSTVTPYCNAIFDNVTAEGCGGAGMHLENMKVRGRNVKLRGNKGGGLVAKHSEVKIEGLEIE